MKKSELKAIIRECIEEELYEGIIDKAKGKYHGIRANMHRRSADKELGKAEDGHTAGLYYARDIDDPSHREGEHRREANWHDKRQAYYKLRDSRSSRKKGR